jgi:phage protein D
MVSMIRSYEVSRLSGSRNQNQPWTPETMAEDGSVETRTPRVRVKIGNDILRHVLDARIVSTNYYSADWFQIGLLAPRVGTYSVSWWASAQRPLVEVGFSVDGGANYVELITGRVDNLSVDGLRGVVRLSGRDLSASLVDSNLRDAFPNHSADAIVSLLARRHGLIPRVAPTPGLVGRIFGGLREDGGTFAYSRASSDWDLIVRLATQYGYDAFVSGRALYFQPSNGMNGAAVSISPSMLSELRIERNLAEPSGNGMAFASWDANAGRTVQQGDLAVLGADRGAGTGNVVVRPNLDAAMMAEAARNFLVESRQHAFLVEMSMPADVVLLPRTVIQLTGTDTSFDRFYKVECVDRSLNPTGGYYQRIRARPRLLAP